MVWYLLVHKEALIKQGIWYISFIMFVCLFLLHYLYQYCMKLAAVMCNMYIYTLLCEMLDMDFNSREESDIKFIQAFVVILEECLLQNCPILPRF